MAKASAPQIGDEIHPFPGQDAVGKLVRILDSGMLVVDMGGWEVQVNPADLAPKKGKAKDEKESA